MSTAKPPSRISIKCRIASLNVEIDAPRDSSTSLLENELAIYPAFDPSCETDVVITVCARNEVLEGTSEKISKNPSLFTVLEDGISLEFKSGHVFWSTDPGPVQIRFSPPPVKKNWIRKIGSMQYHFPHENIGQIFHELVFVPTLQLFFANRFALIHGSAVKNSKGEISVFAGTGGVGKTSMMLELVDNQDHSFVADDISILGDDGVIHANFAFPKIYGYNTLGYPEIKQRLFRKKSLLDRASWKLRILLRGGPANVRRRVNPCDFFDGRVESQGPLTRLYVLFRCNTDELKVEKISSDDAVKMNTHIMMSEYGVLYNYLHWYSFNCIGNGKQADERFVYDKLLGKSSKIQENVLSDVECLKISVPMKMTAQELKHQLTSLLLER